MTPETKELMQATLPKGWEIVEDRTWEGKSDDYIWAPQHNKWTVLGSRAIMLPAHAWDLGYRYARKMKVTWTTEPPTEPGWYWVRWPDDGPRDYCEPTIEDVWKDGDDLYVANSLLSDQPSALWWPIPIQPPKGDE